MARCRSSTEIHTSTQTCRSPSPVLSSSHSSHQNDSAPHSAIRPSCTQKGCQPLAMPLNRTPGYSPLKIFDPWFCRGVQSAIFHYATCQDYKNWKSAKERGRQAEKAAKARAAEQAIITEQPRPIPQLQPLPFETNKGWSAEIKMGRKYDPTMRTTLDRRVSSGNARPRADTGDSDRYDYYRAKNPEVIDRSPPIVSRLPPPERKDELNWIKSPPPSRAVMEGRENPAENAPQRWPLCNIDRSPQELLTARNLARKKLLDQSAAELQANLPQRPEKAYLDYIPRLPREDEALGRENGYMAETGFASFSTYDSLFPPPIARENTSNRSGKPTYEGLSKASTRQSSRVFSMASAWDSEPDPFCIRLPRRGKPRVSSLMAVQKGDTFEIRGASHNYELFWKDQSRPHSVPAGTS